MESDRREPWYLPIAMGRGAGEQDFSELKAWIYSSGADEVVMWEFCRLAHLAGALPPSQRLHNLVNKSFAAWSESWERLSVDCRGAMRESARAAAQRQRDDGGCSGC